MIFFFGVELIKFHYYFIKSIIINLNFNDF